MISNFVNSKPWLLNNSVSKVEGEVKIFRNWAEGINFIGCGYSLVKKFSDRNHPPIRYVPELKLESFRTLGGKRPIFVIHKSYFEEKIIGFHRDKIGNVVERCL